MMVYPKAMADRRIEVVDVDWVADDVVVAIVIPTVSGFRRVMLPRQPST